MPKPIADGSFYIQRSNQDFWLRENGLWVRKGNIRDDGASGLVNVAPVITQGFDLSATLSRRRFLESMDDEIGFDLAATLDRIRDIVNTHGYGVAFQATLDRIRPLVAASAYGLTMSSVLTVIAASSLDLAVSFDYGMTMSIAMLRKRDIAVSEAYGAAMNVTLDRKRDVGDLGQAQLAYGLNMTAPSIIRQRRIAASMAYGFSQSTSLSPILGVTVAASVGFSMTVTLIGAFRFLIEGDASSPFVRWLDATLTKVSDPATIPSGAVQTVDSSPDGKFTAVATATAILIYDMTSGAPIKVTGIASPPSWLNIVKIKFSPDSSKLLVIDNTVSPFVWVYNTSTWTTTTAPNPGRAVQQAAWSGDGTKIALGLMATPFLVIYTASTGAVLTTPATQAAGTVRGMSWSADGAHLALQSASTDFLVYRTDTWATLSPPATLPAGATASLPNTVEFSPDSTKVVFSTGTSPFMWVYSLTGTGGNTLTYISPPSTLPAAQVRALAWKGDSSTLYVGFQNTASPRLFSYNASTWVKNTDPPSQPGGNPFCLQSSL